jgi:hypothetical protein
MAIVSSTLQADPFAQADGRTYVRELHVDGQGAQYRIEYLAAVGLDRNAVMAARAVALANELADEEFRRCVDAGTFTVLQQTGAQLAARFRAAYRAASREQAARLAYWLLERINAGQVTDAQVQSAFGLTAAQYTAMKARATTLHDGWAAVLAAAGE